MELLRMRRNERQDEQVQVKSDIGNIAFPCGGS